MASLLNSLDKVRGEQSVGDLGTLRHDSDPGGKLGVILGESEGGIVAISAELVHVALVNNSPDEAIVGRVVHLQRRGILAKNRNQILLLAVESVYNSLVFLSGGLPALEEEAAGVLHEVNDRVVALGHLERNIQKSHVLASSRICGELVGSLLLQLLFRVGQLHGDGVAVLGVRHAIEANDGEFLLEGRNVSLGPLFRLATVPARAPDMEEEDDQDERHNQCLLHEVAGRSALPDPVPCREWHSTGA